MMATFSEWLVFDEIREEVYLGSLQRLAIQEAAREVFEFCGMAARGRWDLILENYDEDEDAAPRIRKKKKRRDSMLPSELRSGRGDWNPPDEDDYHDSHSDEKWQGLRVQDDLGGEDEEKGSEVELASGADSSEVVQRAKRMQRLLFLTRWAAMLDRREDIARVEKIYKEEVLPLLKLMEWSYFREAYEDDDEDDFVIDDSDEDFVVDDSDEDFVVDDEPEQEPKKTKEQIQRESNEVALKLRPLLEKLGYLRAKHIPDHYTDEQTNRVIFERAALAAAEQGNDPFAEEEVKRLGLEREVREMERNTPTKAMSFYTPREHHKNELSAEIRNLIEAAAERKEQKSGVSFVDSDGRTRRTNKKDMEDIITTETIRIWEQMGKREVLDDGTAKPWKKSTNAFTIEPEDEESAKHYLNSLKSATTQGSEERDEKRKERKQKGLAPSSEAVFECPSCGHRGSAPASRIGQMVKCPKCDGEAKVHAGDSIESMDEPVAGAEGEQSTRGYADPNQATPEAEVAAGESGRIMIDAFRQSMLELRKEKPSLAVMMCIWMGLDCDPDGSVSDENIRRFASAMGSSTMGTRQTPWEFINRIAASQVAPNMQKRWSENSTWELVKMLVARRVQVGSMPRMGNIPPGNPPENPPSAEGKSAYMSRHSFSPSDKAWYDYLKKIDDAKGDAMQILVKKMYEIMAEKDTSMRPLGWRSPCSWDIVRFLKASYKSDFDAGTASLSEQTPGQIVFTLYNKNKKSKKIREYSISNDGRSVRIVQVYPSTWDKEVFGYEIPQSDIRCQSCGGTGGPQQDCPECDGCGSTMNRAKTIKLEMDIKYRLNLKRTNRAKKA
jgi:Zn finger protein HypA/HybF involved in hydrogenase expression